tara:strand:+ start:390 stop:758 length:369 start_codon:yes stop_codon:yes gene_type:complete
MFAHLITVAPCLFIGAYLLLVQKGTSKHRMIGKVYLSLMFFTAVISLFLPAHVGSQFLHHFGWIHLFSLLTIYTVPTAIIAVKKGNIRSHKRKMILLYFGALIIAGGFTLAPGRYLHGVFFG